MLPTIYFFWHEFFACSFSGFYKCNGWQLTWNDSIELDWRWSQSFFFPAWFTANARANRCEIYSFITHIVICTTEHLATGRRMDEISVETASTCTFARNTQMRPLTTLSDKKQLTRRANQIEAHYFSARKRNCCSHMLLAFTARARVCVCAFTVQCSQSSDCMQLCNCRLFWRNVCASVDWRQIQTVPLMRECVASTWKKTI